MQEAIVKGTRTGALCAVAAIGGMALPAAASAAAAPTTATTATPLAGGWTPATTLDASSSGQRVSPAVVGADARGDSLAAWLDGEKIEAAVRPAGGRYTAPATLFTSGGQVDPPVVAVDPRGDAAVAWVDSESATDSEYLEMRPASGPIVGPVQIASGPDDQTPVVGIDSSGLLTIAYATASGIVVRSGRVGGPLGPPEGLPDSANSQPVLAVGGQGDAVVAWQAYNATSNQQTIDVVTRSGSGDFSTPTTIAAGSADEPAVSINARGEATVAWQQYNASYQSSIMASSQPAPGQFGPPQAISPAGASNPQLAENDAGQTVAAWTIEGGPAQASFAQPGQPFGAATTVSGTAAGTSASSAATAIAADGSAVVAWGEYNGSDLVIQAATRTAGGRLSSAATLSDPTVNATTPSVAAGNGTADAAGWGSLTSSYQEGGAVVSNHLGGS